MYHFGIVVRYPPDRSVGVGDMPLKVGRFGKEKRRHGIHTLAAINARVVAPLCRERSEPARHGLSLDSGPASLPPRNHD